MNELAAAALAGAGVALLVLCSLGVAAMHDPLARVHYAAPGGLAAVLVAVGLLIGDGLGQLTGRALLLAALLAIAAPIQSHVIARAIRLRETGALAPEKRAP